MIKITYRMAISDSMLARRDLPFQFDKSRNLPFSIVFGFKTIIFNKLIINYHFLSFSIGFLSNFYHLLSDFYRILSFWDVSCQQILDRKKALSPTLSLLADIENEGQTDRAEEEKAKG